MFAGMQVTVNGEARELPEGISVGDLLRELELSERRLAVEINLEILPREAFTSRQIAPGDVVEIVHFIGGG